MMLTKLSLVLVAALTIGIEGATLLKNEVYANLDKDVYENIHVSLDTEELKRGSVENLTPEDFLVTDLPGLVDEINFKHYAGYMPATDGTEFFFWFVESQESPETDPVLLWLNGGPGSSSVEFGFWAEHGPFRLEDENTVRFFQHSWNRKASVLYIESPSGVGFSWSKRKEHYKATDPRTSWDNYNTLLNFFTVFKDDFSHQDVYLTGESYGGHYIPQLSERVLDNKDTDEDGSALFNRMKGLLIGNPGIESDWYYNINEYAFQTFLWSHALLPQKAFLKSVEACDWNDFLTNCQKDFTKPSKACVAANTEAYKYVPKSWDVYNINAPTCHKDNSVANSTVKRPHLSRSFERFSKVHGFDESYDPCYNDIPITYMNRKDVKKAIHADKRDNGSKGWPQDVPNWEYGDKMADITKLIEKFYEFAPHWRILVVSGDADAAVPFMGTQRWIECLGRKVNREWQNWYMDGDVAGSVIVYDGITFQTVKNCGHMIPQYCPKAGWQFFDHWLQQTKEHRPL